MLEAAKLAEREPPRAAAHAVLVGADGGAEVLGADGLGVEHAPAEAERHLGGVCLALVCVCVCVFLGRAGYARGVFRDLEMPV